METVEEDTGMYDDEFYVEDSESLDGFNAEDGGMPMSVVQWLPRKTAKSLSPLFLLCFNQRISSAAILSHISLSLQHDPNPGEAFVGTDFELVEESIAQKEWPHIIKEQMAGMWVAFKLREKLLQKSTSYVLYVPSGCPSAEGDLTSTTDWSASFSTYGPLVVTSYYECAVSGGPRTLRYYWSIHLSNELDHSSVSNSVVRVSPRIGDFKVMHTEGESSISVHPVLMLDRAKYVVTFDESIKDVYAQHLESSSATAEFESGSVGYMMHHPQMVILNPSTRSDPFISLTLFRFPSLHIQVFQVDVNDYSSLDRSSFNKNEYAEGKSWAVGKSVYDQEVELELKRGKLHEHKICLGSLLQHQDCGQVFVIAEPTERAWEQCQCESSPYYDIVLVWVQCTRLSLDVFPDQVNGCYIAWVSSLENGAPISNATVRVGSRKQDTDEDGLAILIADSGSKNETIVAQKGPDITFMPVFDSDHDGYEWYGFDSGGLYTPTEEVRIKRAYKKARDRERWGSTARFCKKPCLL